MNRTEFSGSIEDPTEWGTSTAGESVWTPTHTEVPGKSNHGSPLSVLPGSRITAASYEDSQGRHLCVYWQDEKGIIRESLYLRNKEQWKFIRSVFVTDGAKRESPLTAVMWANGVERRLYYLDRWNLIREAVCNDGFSWSENNSELTPLKVATHARSGLAAGCWRVGKDELCLRIYYQDQHSQLQELKFSSNHPGWHHGYKDLPRALPGSTLAFGAQLDTGYLHLYYQRQDGQLAETHYMPFGWINLLNIWLHGGYHPAGHYPPHTAIACIVRSLHLRIFALKDDGHISDTIWGWLAWGPTNILPIKIPNVSHFVALEWMEPGVQNGWQQHIVGINTADGTFWDYITGSQHVESQKLFE